jgi:hypothetical protein
MMASTKIDTILIIYNKSRYASKSQFHFLIAKSPLKLLSGNGPATLVQIDQPFGVALIGNWPNFDFCFNTKVEVFGLLPSLGGGFMELCVLARLLHLRR